MSLEVVVVPVVVVGSVEAPTSYNTILQKFLVFVFVFRNTQKNIWRILYMKGGMTVRRNK